MKLDISKINLSKADIRRGLNLPKGMSKSLAEDIGIMIGDGHIGSYSWGAYPICVSGNAVKDKDYVVKHIKKLKSKLFNLNLTVLFVGKNKSEIRLQGYSKGLVEFYNKVIGLPVNRKKDIGIPKCIWSRKEYLTACLRGILDTDFGLSFKKKEKYPVLQLKTCSKKLVLDCKKAFGMMGINANAYLDIKHIHSVTKRSFTSHYLFINGRKNLKKCIEEIGFNNSRMINLTRKKAGPRGNS